MLPGSHLVPSVIAFSDGTPRLFFATRICSEPHNIQSENRFLLDPKVFPHLWNLKKRTAKLVNPILFIVITWGSSTSAMKTRHTQGTFNWQAFLADTNEWMNQRPQPGFNVWPGSHDLQAPGRSHNYAILRKDWRSLEPNLTSEPAIKLGFLQTNKAQTPFLRPRGYRWKGQCEPHFCRCVFVVIRDVWLLLLHLGKSEEFLTVSNWSTDAHTTSTLISAHVLLTPAMAPFCLCIQTMQMKTSHYMYSKRHDIRHVTQPWHFQDGWFTSWKLPPWK